MQQTRFRPERDVCAQVWQLGAPAGIPCQAVSICVGERMSKTKFYIAVGILALALCLTLLSAGWGLSLINLPGLVLVFGGTFLASVIGHSTAAVVDLLRRLPMIFRASPRQAFKDLRPFLQVANLCRRGDVRGAERVAATMQDDFLREGALLALDPHGSAELVRMLKWRVRKYKDEEGNEVRILRTMATFAPAFGMLGTLFGLVSLLDELGVAGLHQIGVAMGFALMSTLYGLMAANLLFRPLALKLEDHSRQRLARMGFLTEAIIMLHERQHPMLISEYLESGIEIEPDPVEAPVAEPLALGRV
jgi:chemotaxis protein MotA